MKISLIIVFLILGYTANCQAFSLPFFGGRKPSAATLQLEKEHTTIKMPFFFEDKNGRVQKAYGYFESRHYEKNKKGSEPRKLTLMARFGGWIAKLGFLAFLLWILVPTGISSAALIWFANRFRARTRALKSTVSAIKASGAVRENPKLHNELIKAQPAGSSNAKIIATLKSQIKT